jgi:hypothetical protein
MSRGFGWVQLAAVAYLHEHRIAFTSEIAFTMFCGAPPYTTRIGEHLRHPNARWQGPDPSPSDIRSLRRALRRLRAQGLVASCGKTELLWMMPRGVPARLGWLPRGPGPDIRYGFDPSRQRRAPRSPAGGHDEGR